MFFYVQVETQEKTGMEDEEQKVHEAQGVEEKQVDFSEKV